MDHDIYDLVNMFKGQQTTAYLWPKKIQFQDQEGFYKFNKQKTRLNKTNKVI